MDPTMLYKAAKEGDIKVLIRYKDHFETQLSPKGNTVLHIAAMHEKKQGVNTILGICPSLLGRVNSQGETPFHIAARAGHDGIVQALFDFVDQQNNDIEIGRLSSREMLGGKNVDGDTAFHMAVRNGHLDVVKLLLEKDPTFSYHPNIEGETPMYLAGKKGFDGIVSEILRTYTLPLYGNLYGGPNGRTVLHAAVIFNSKECTTKLLNWRVSLAKEADVDGWTPLHHAASQGHVNLIKVLLSICPDCWEIDNIKGQNIFHIAVENNKYNVVEYIKNNSSLNGLINQKDNAGNTYDPQLLAAPTNVHVPNTESRKSGSNLSNSQEDRIEAHKKMGDTHMIVAALIATITFTAGLTVPGGYYGNDGPNPGMAILSRTAAFKGFIVTDTVALVLSVIAILCYFDAAWHDVEEKKLKIRYRNAGLVVAHALVAMMIAYVTGTYAVLANSLDIAIATCVLGSIIVLISYLYYMKYALRWIDEELFEADYIQFVLDRIKAALFGACVGGNDD